MLGAQEVMDPDSADTNNHSSLPCSDILLHLPCNSIIPASSQPGDHSNDRIIFHHHSFILPLPCETHTFLSVWQLDLKNSCPRTSPCPNSSHSSSVTFPRRSNLTSWAERTQRSGSFGPKPIQKKPKEQESGFATRTSRVSLQRTWKILWRGERKKGKTLTPAWPARWGPSCPGSCNGWCPWDSCQMNAKEGALFSPWLSPVLPRKVSSLGHHF